MCWGVCLGLAQKEMSTDISSSVSTCKLFQNCLLMGFFLKCKNTQSASVKIILKLCNIIWFFNESLSIGLSFFSPEIVFPTCIMSKTHYVLCFYCSSFMWFHVLLLQKTCFFISSKFAHDQKSAYSKT